MKAFEEWNKKRGQEIISEFPNKISEYINDERKAAFQAALKHLLYAINEEPILVGRDNIMAYIKQELEGK